MSITHTLAALEEQGWYALAEGSGGAFYRAHLSEDAVMIVPGAAPLSREAVLAVFDAAPPWSWFRLEEMRVLPLTDNSAVVVYRATAQREGQPEYSAQMSSVYVRQDGAWKLALHQQTPL